jgi:glycosyltransferase involved in cell wall biosynthesis
VAFDPIFCSYNEDSLPADHNGYGSCRKSTAPESYFVSLHPHVLVDATSIPRNRGGVGRNLEYLIPALDRAGARLTVVAKPHDVGWLAEAAPGARVLTPPGLPASRPGRLLWEQFGLPAVARRERADLIFSPHYTMPLLTGIPVVVALYDAIFFSSPELHSPLKRRFFQFWIRRSLTRAAACVVPSEATRSELFRLVRPKRRRVFVAPLGVDGGVFHVPDASESAAARELVGGASWVAFLGTLEPRKNVGNLVRAFGAVVASTEIAAQFPGLLLALAGGKGWDTELEGVIDSSPVKDRIRRLGFVPNEALSGILGASIATAYPSLGEGFGFPVIEAMACGSPLLTTRLLSLPEVGGDVAVYAEPDADSIAAALTALLLDDAGRADRSRRGPERAASFSWAASAAAHLAVFDAVAGGAR